ncbi:MAG: plasmid mobilization relaxosome protein MobC, partial [Moraxella osloensis]|nr:plasmid mobilization relaxosome protein MobC [Moraxella osloensis]
VKRVRDFPDVDPILNRQLVSIGRNLNQITKLANSQNVAFGKIDTVTLVQSLDRITEELKLLRQQYTASNQNVS